MSWIGHNFPPLPSVFQINGGLGGGALEGEVPPHFHCMCPPVGESQVCGPSLSPADVVKAAPSSPTAATPGLSSGLWWKLLSLQPLRLIALLPVLGLVSPKIERLGPISKNHNVCFSLSIFANGIFLFYFYHEPSFVNIRYKSKMMVHGLSPFTFIIASEFYLL